MHMLFWQCKCDGCCKRIRWRKTSGHTLVGNEASCSNFFR